LPETNYQEMYLSEALEHIEIMNQALLKLEENPKSKEYIDLIFRSAHTIKGMATTMGYVQTKELCKNIENIFDKIRKKQKEMTPQLATAIFKCIDSLYQMITDTNKKIDLDSLISILENPEESKDINNFDTISSVQLRWKSGTNTRSRNDYLGIWKI